MLQVAELDGQLVSDVARFTHDPLGFVKFAYPWGEPGELEQNSGPRDWQTEILGLIGKHFSDPETKAQPCCIGVCSGKGIGKSALMAMVSGWGISTCEDTKIVVTANTEPQLRTKTWPEVS